MFVQPFVNPFVSPFGNTGFKIQEPQQPRPKENKYLNFMADRQGCGMWRIGFAEYLINMTGMGESTSVTKMISDPNWYADLKVVKLQRQASNEQKGFVQWLKSIQPRYGFKMIYEVDDVVFREDIPDYNIYKAGFDNDQIRQNCIDIINLCDEVTVTCKHMRDLYRTRTGKQEITVVPNFPPYWWFGHQYNYNKVVSKFDYNRKKPRIVYAGSGAHFDIHNLVNQKDDFEGINEFIIKNLDKYQFVFIGATSLALRPYIESGQIEYHDWKSLIEYPNFLASLDAQLFIAPLQDNSFNRSKSDIKYIEAACLGIPCLCQDITTYENAIPELRFKTPEELEAKVEKLLNWKNRSKYYELIPKLREIGAARFLERPENIGAFMEALNTPYGSPLRQFLRPWN